MVTGAMPGAVITAASAAATSQIALTQAVIIPNPITALRAEERHPGDVPTRPREAGREPVPDRVAHDRHHDGDSSGRLLCSEGRGGIAGENEIEIKTEQLRRQLWESLDPSIRSPVFDDDVLPLHIPALAQSLPKGVDRSPLLGRLK